MQFTILGLFPLIIYIYFSRFNILLLINLALDKSSIPSLIIDTAITVMKGITAVSGPIGDIIDIHCKIAHIKKYTFAKRRN